MTYTEEEAKAKWCPFARVSSYGRESSWNRTGPQRVGDPAVLVPAWSLCLGSACMAWRAIEQWRPRSDYQWDEGRPHLTGPNVERRTVGYCGLAGQAAPTATTNT